MMKDSPKSMLFVAGVVLGAVAGALIAAREARKKSEARGEDDCEEWGEATPEMIARMPKVRSSGSLGVEDANSKPSLEEITPSILTHHGRARRSSLAPQLIPKR